MNIETIGYIIIDKETGAGICFGDQWDTLVAHDYDATLFNCLSRAQSKCDKLKTRTSSGYMISKIMITTRRVWSNEQPT